MTSPASPPVAVRDATADAARLTASLRDVYAAAFGAPPYGEPPEKADRFATDQLAKHVERTGFRLVVAERGEALVGFAYGYTGERGQFWSDWVVRAAPADVTDTWVGGHFEVVELAVTPDAQRQGLGRRLVTALLDGLPHDRALLTTSTDDARPAPRLYRSLGWTVLARLDDENTLYGLDRR